MTLEIPLCEACLGALRRLAAIGSRKRYRKGAGAVLAGCAQCRKGLAMLPRHTKVHFAVPM